LKSYFVSTKLSCLIFLKSKISAGTSGFFSFKISINSHKLSIQITSIQGIIEASKTFSFGINICLNHFSLAQIVDGKTQFISLNFQSRDNSQIKIELSNKSFFTSRSCDNIQTAIGKSKPEPDFLMSAGAIFTTILVTGSLVPLDFIAERSLSLASFTHWSGSQTISKYGIPLFISTSTSIKSESNQFTAIEFILLIIRLKVKSLKSLKC
jgi:hypothetical protein